MNIPLGLCQCGCGQPTKIAKKTHTKSGWMAGRPRRFVIGHGRWANSLEERLWSRIEKRGPSECWPWTGAKNRAGYGGIHVSGRSTTAHHALYEFINGPLPDKHIVCHACDNPSCCNPAHLFSGTTMDNVRDKMAKGRQLRGDDIARKGEQNGESKLTTEQVLEIRRLGESRELTRQEIAQQFRVSRSAIYKVLARQTWKHI